MANGLGLTSPLKAQRFVREDQHGTRNHRLRDDRLIEIYDLFDFLPVQLTLKSFLAPLDTCNELRHVVVLRDLALGDLFTFEKIATRKAHFVQKLDCIVGDEIEGSFLL